jgi:hypothetical protein
VKAAGYEWKAFGIGIETHSASRNHALSDIAEHCRSNSKAERAPTWASDKAFVGQSTGAADRYPEAHKVRPELPAIQETIASTRPSAQFRQIRWSPVRARGQTPGIWRLTQRRFTKGRVCFARVAATMLGQGVWLRSQNFARKATKCFIST